MPRFVSVWLAVLVAITVIWAAPGVAADRLAVDPGPLALIDFGDPGRADPWTPLASPSPMTERPSLLSDGTLVARACCKHCSSGKPCGNSCISRKKACYRGRGCACAGDGGDDVF